MSSNSTSASWMPELTASRDGADGARQDIDLRSMFRQSMPAPDWALPRHRVVVALVDLRHWQPWLDEARALIDSTETERMQRQRRLNDRQTLTLAYAMHRLLLAEALQASPLEVPLYRDERGCPRLRDGRMQTSLSHTDGFIALAMCADGPVGVDVELSGRASSMQEIAGQVCHAAEAAALAGLAKAERQKALLSLWVRKEAMLKAAGIGLAHEMSGFLAPENEPLPLPARDGESTHVRMLDAGPVCTAAVASPMGVPVTYAWLRPAGSGTAGDCETSGTA